ncbi:sulfite exporter TauE/SafE family protein [Rhodococcus sp. X156]|uniref:sulfite exporter TauE/SafE family protein n=1 Tax=Rhodococcus sp. X156 TaxID=2499145 RepID=UPI000FD83E2B|nr:sulfite exporter TauE/SafE family protein [Rhodococcus sp. X156]
MPIDPSLSLAGLVVGLLVGLTGMGGGALLTPLLVLVFGVQPLAAISSDLVTSLVMKPVGAAVHLRRKTVQTGLVWWLALGAVPAGFLGSLLIGSIGHSADVQHYLKIAIGVALVGSFGCTIARLVLDRRAGTPGATGPLVVKPVRTVAIGVVGGVAVGMTSVGAGSLIIAMLLLAYPRLRPAQLVGTDIVQAIPLVAAAALGHLLFGEVHFGVTASLLVGALPGVYVGARLSAQASASFTRPVVAGVLLGSALALLSAPTPVLVLGAAAAAAGTCWLGRGPVVPDHPPVDLVKREPVLAR